MAQLADKANGVQAFQQTHSCEYSPGPAFCTRSELQQGAQSQRGRSSQGRCDILLPVQETMLHCDHWISDHLPNPPYHVDCCIQSDTQEDIQA